MIIDSIVCTKVTREITDLMRSYNIAILTVELGPYDKLIVSYRANRIFEANQFKELTKVLDEVVQPATLIWDEIAFEYLDMFTVDKEYEVIRFAGPGAGMVEIRNDNDLCMLVSVNSSVYGENRIITQ